MLVLSEVEIASKRRKIWYRQLPHLEQNVYVITRNISSFLLKFTVIAYLYFMMKEHVIPVPFLMIKAFLAKVFNIIYSCKYQRITLSIPPLIMQSVLLFAGIFIITITNMCVLCVGKIYNLEAKQI